MKTITIGRSPQSTIVVDPSFETVSNNHAEITLQDDDRVKFTDHSSNGTVINGTAVCNRSVYVTGDDVIRLADKYVVEWEQVYALIPELALALSKRTQRPNKAQPPAVDDGATQILPPGQAYPGPGYASQSATINQKAKPTPMPSAAPSPAPAGKSKSKNKGKNKAARSSSVGQSKPFYRSNLAMVIIAFIAVMVIIAFTVFDDVIKNLM